MKRILTSLAILVGLTIAATSMAQPKMTVTGSTAVVNNADGSSTITDAEIVSAKGVTFNAATAIVDKDGNKVKFIGPVKFQGPDSSGTAHDAELDGKTGDLTASSVELDDPKDA